MLLVAQLDDTAKDLRDQVKEYKALRLTVELMLELGPETTIEDLFRKGYYVLPSRRYNPNVDGTNGSASGKA